MNKKALKNNKKMIINKTYQVAWRSKKYTKYLQRVRCIKETLKCYLVISNSNETSFVPKNKILVLSEYKNND